jgi:tetratricopeptide (TPR) repeat protein
MGKNGFGKSAPPTRDAKKFMRAFMDCVVEAKGNETKIHQFFKSNSAKLDKSLLDAFPLVFDTLTAEQLPDKRENIASFFWIFGNSIRRFPLGDRMLNLELSIAAYELALNVYTHEGFPENWATAQNNLGNSYRNRLRGERAENLEKAIAAYELALQVRTREAFPEDWAATQNNLGNAYCDRLRGERAENMEKAIAAYELALQVYTREAFPEKWAATQNNLGAAYSNRLRGGRSENLEKAIAAFELALQIYVRDAFPEMWAMTQNNLGVVYGNRIRRERAENLEKAIVAFELALQVHTREAFPEDWATAKHNLANAYRDRILGKQSDNLAQAIATYEQSAQVFTRESFPEKWAENQGHMAEALMKKASLTETFVDLDAAITLLQKALEVSSPGSSIFIDSQYRLGSARSLRYEHSQNPNDLQQSLQAYKIALDAISPEHYDRKAIWQALPTTQTILGSRLVRDGQWQDGLQLLLNSVNQLSTSDDLLAHANALFQTGRAYEALVDWDKARLYYRDALRLYEHLQNQPGIAKSHAGLGGVLVSQGHLEKGISELAKARESYHQLEQSEKAAEVESFRQTAQKVMESQMIEAYV